MQVINDFVAAYGVTILYTIITAIASYIGLWAKALYAKYMDDNVKRSVVRTAVQAVEQLYRDLSGPAKLDKAIESAVALLSERGIMITDLELRLLIEAAVAEFSNTFMQIKDSE